MTSSKLKHWIAESESWQSFIDYNIPRTELADYIFLKSADDFYISLMSEAFDLMDSQNTVDNIEEKYFSIARGLDIFSLKHKKEAFSGVDENINTLFICGLYYLANYSPSSILRAKLTEENNFTEEIEIFLVDFFNRKLNLENEYSFLLNKFLCNYDEESFNMLVYNLSSQKESALAEGSSLFILYKLAVVVINNLNHNNLWHDLLIVNESVDYWKKFIDININKSIPIWDFFPSQRQAILSGILEDNKAFTLQMPTSSGKTALCELVIYNYVKQNQSNSKILFLAPFRALASELKLQFTDNLKSYGIKAKSIYGGNTSTNYEKTSIDNVDLLISTPEKFMAIEGAIPDFISRFGLIICDEGHLLDDANRGLSYELLLSRLKQNSNVQFIFISAILPNVIDINKWLNGTDDSVVISDYRPSVLEYCLLNEQNNSNFQLEVNPTKNTPQKYFLSKFISNVDVKYKSQETGRNRTYPLAPNYAKTIIVALKSLKLGSAAIFSPTKSNNGVEGIARHLINFPSELMNRYIWEFDRSFLYLIEKYCELLFGSDYLLTQCVRKGFAFHHGDLPQNIREIIEEGIRTGAIQLVICTNTLAEGVNLPIKTIVVSSTKRFDFDSGKLKPIKKRDLKNLFGRAGRAGKEIKGTVIAVNSNDFVIIKELARDAATEIAEGFLHKIVKAISIHINGKIDELTPELISKATEKLKSLIDYIDVSLITLRGDSIMSEDFDESLDILVENTFSFSLLDKDDKSKFEKDVLKKLFTIRNEALLPYSQNFSSIKSSGCSIREYDEIINCIDFESEIWNMTSLNNDVWNFYFDNCLEHLDKIQRELSNFNEENSNAATHVNLTISDIKLASKLWSEGHWYWEIANKLGITITCTLRLIHNFVGFTIQSTLNSINCIRADSAELPSALNDFPRSLELGISTKIQLALMEAGLNDRCIVHCISSCELFQSDNITPKTVKIIIKSNKLYFLDCIKELPELCIDKFSNYIK